MSRDPVHEEASSTGAGTELVGVSKNMGDGVGATYEAGEGRESHLLYEAGEGCESHRSLDCFLGWHHW